MHGPIADCWNGDHSRGVSDLVAFVLTFSVIITAVAAVSLGGVGSLQDFRDEARAESAQVSMTGFDSSMEDIRTDGVPQRSHQLELNGDGLSRHNSELEITISGTPAGVQTRTVNVGAFARVTGDDTAIVYETGTVYRSQNRGQTLLREPPFRCGTDTAYVGLVSVRGDVNVSSDTLALRARQDSSASVYPDLTAGENGSASSVQIDVTGTYDRAAWEQLFEREMSEWSDTGSGTYTCDGVNRVYVHDTTVELDVVT